MLEVLRKEKRVTKKIPETQDVIIKKISYNETVDEEGNIIIKKQEKSVNLTKKINETKKIIKTNNADEKLAEIEKIFTK